MALEDDNAPPAPLGFHPPGAKPIDDARKSVFLSHLARHGIPTAAAKAASPHTQTGNLAGFIHARGKDTAFDEAWEMALQMATDAVESEIHRRGVEGYEEEVWYRGEKVGETTKYSDSLLLARMKAMDPARYGTSHSKVEKTTEEIKSISFTELSTDQRELMRKLLLSDATDAEIIEPTQIEDTQP